jgi:hypothetical protein
MEIPFELAGEPPPDAVSVDEPEGIPASFSVSIFPPHATTRSPIRTDTPIRRMARV